MRQQSECQSDVNFWCFEPTDKRHGNTKLIWMATHCDAFESSSAVWFLELQLFSVTQCRGNGGTMKDQQEGMSSLVRGTHVPVRPPIGPQATKGSNGHPDPKRCRVAF